MRVLILGGDGYLGWPTAMHLSAHGHEVFVVDNYLRRRLCLEVDSRPLYDPPLLPERVARWSAVGGAKIGHAIGDCADYRFLEGVVERFGPEAIVHYAEQPSGPYSMVGFEQARLTLNNNLATTLNLIWAVHQHAPTAHIVKLGTMGEYGTPNIDIEEGWLTVEHNGRSDRFLFPRQASSLYHTSKVMDTDLLWFYVRMWGLRVTDLMQGPVYGLHTDETAQATAHAENGEPDASLLPIFNYDDIFGTVLNRFLTQAVAGMPLTVYGKGGQTRGYLNLRDTLQCIRLVVEHPVEQGQLRVFNQFTELFTVRDLAERVQQAARQLGLSVETQSVPNPRVESEEHYYNAQSTGLRDLGLEPHLLTEDVLVAMLQAVMRYRDRIDQRLIMPRVGWRA